MTLEETIKRTQSAIRDSGRSFDKISKDSIIDYLRDIGIKNSDQREQVYQKLKTMNSVTHPSVTTAINNQMDVNDTPNNTVPVKQPRKSIFGEIKRVA